MIRKIFRLLIVFLLCAIVFNVAVVAGLSQQTSKAETITMKELKDHVYFLASDEMKGRVTGTEEYKKAVSYCEREIKNAGLKPIIKDSQGKESFLQLVPFSKQKVEDIGPLTVNTAGGKKEFKHNENFKFISVRSAEISGKPLPVVFVGYGIEDEDSGWNDFKELDLKGKAVVVLPGVPMREDKPVLSEESHKLYTSRNGEFRKRFTLLRNEPAIIINVADESDPQEWDKLTSAAEESRLSYAGGSDSERGRMSRFMQVPAVTVKKEFVEMLFKDQEYSSLEGLEGYTTYDLKNTTVTFNYALEEETVYSWNVVAMVEGTDPVLRNEYVTVGAHLDHVRPRNGEVCNGADDNASGSVGVLEVAEAVAMSPSKRSVIFILYTAEEMGLNGSAHFLADCPVPVESIIVNVNLDMIGRTDEASMKTRSHYVVGAEQKCSEMREIIEQVNARTVNWPLTFLKQNEIRGGSDHQQYWRKNIPAFFFFSGMHEDLHRPTDDPEKIEYDKMQKIAQLVYELTMELGNRPQKPCVE